MMTETNKDRLPGIGLLVGSTIGAGIFSLPYVFKTAGLAAGFFYLIVGAAAYIAVYFMYADIIAATAGEHRLVGYAKIYLGRFWFLVTILTAIVQVLFVLTIYLILSVSFASLVSPLGEPFHKMLIFWFFCCISIFIGLRRIAWMEFLVSLAMVAVILLVFVFGVPHFAELGTKVDFLPTPGNLFFPLPPILFALAGLAAIPEVAKLRVSLKKTIALGVVISAAIYAVFVLSILALAPVITQDAVSGLAGAVPHWVLVTIGVLGILSLFSSYITSGLNVYESLKLDLGAPDWLRTGLVVFSPIVLYLTGFNNFIGLIGLVGGIFLALESITIVLIWMKAKKRRLSVGTGLLILVFALALVYEIIK